MKKIKHILLLLIDIIGIPAYCLGYLIELNKDAFKLGRNSYDK